MPVRELKETYHVGGLVYDGEAAAAAQPSDAEPSGDVGGAVGEVGHYLGLDQIPPRVVRVPVVPPVNKDK